jgi:hypothetical protein
MKSKNFRPLSLMVAAIIVLQACSLSSTETPEIAPTEVAVTSATEESPVEIPVTGETALPTEISIRHQTIPANLPADRSNHAGDYDSSALASKKIVTDGDRFTFGRFERPFNANAMDTYFPYLDIVDTFVLQDETWIYGTLILKGPDSNNSLAGKYAVELDLDRDGKGDWLIIASNPASTDWSVNGVQVYQDANNDVGDSSAMYTDEKATGDGFETLVFDQGIGDDPDTAWVRISPSEPNTIELAVKRSVLNDPKGYLINMWAGTSLLDPALFDINDHFTHEQAGAADLGFELYYPIKAVSELDNSCRMAVGYKPTGDEPGLCEVLIPKEKGGGGGSPACIPSPNNPCR